eukprot:TRINITY_DN27360_c0_g1_i1.p1 TRINITY_DN27360_c0_g1~~TRINITY_DN27360_c0_g1_i1.p1  ORF type:complete len:222 (+),score=67.01 TRINITY_DN27360_c0_g1_i1:60-725(+)
MPSVANAAYDWRVEVLAMLMENVTDLAAGVAEEPTVYDAQTPVEVDMKYYLQRWLMKTKLDGSLLIAALCVMDKMLEKTGIALTRHNRHRIVLTSLVIAAKCADDYRLMNTWYARIGGVDLVEINRMERHFLLAVDWEVVVRADEYNTYLALLTSFHERLTARAARKAAASKPAALPRTPKPTPRRKTEAKNKNAAAAKMPTLCKHGGGWVVGAGAVCTRA